MDEVRRAYATLGLKTGASFGEVRRRYRALARRWHPDRHVGDPRNEKEAAERMRRINDAYGTLAAHRERVRSPGPESPRPAATPGRRLTREELDALVESIGPEGPIDWVLEGVGWVGGTLRGVFAMVGGVVLAVRAVLLVASGNLAAIFRDPALLLFFLFLGAALVLLILQEVRKRKELDESVGLATPEEDAPRRIEP